MLLLNEGFDFLFRRHPQPMWVFDPITYAFLDVNDAAVSKYRYSRIEFLQMNVTELYPPEEIPLLLKFYRRQFASYSDEEETVWHHLLGDGTVIRVRITSSSVTYQGRDAILSATTDVTRYLLTEEALYDQRTLVEQAVAIANIGSWGKILDGSEQVQWSSEMYALFGLDPATYVPLVGSIHSLMSPDDVANSYRAAQESLQNGGDYQIEFRIVRGDGELRWLRMLARVLLDENGAPLRVFGVCIDITEDKRRADAELKLTHEIERRNLHEGFMSMLAHEFRTPLTSIETSAELLYLHYQRMGADQRTERIDNIRRQIDHLVSLIDDMQSLIQAETVGLSYHPVLTDLALLTTTVFEETQANTHDERILLYTADRTTHFAMADKKLIRLVLVNLLSNAIKYSEADGRVWLNLRTEGEWITIEVRDEGIGIAEADQTRLFEPFFRAHNVDERPGTGLGLAIVRQAVEAHGGSVVVRSAVDMGTVFTVLLPNRH